PAAGGGESWAGVASDVGSTSSSTTKAMLACAAMSRQLVVTIDGPAGAGKSTVARRLARALGYRLLDTGAIYRAVALAARRAGTDWADAPACAAVAAALPIEFAFE